MGSNAAGKGTLQPEAAMRSVAIVVIDELGQHLKGGKTPSESSGPGVDVVQAVQDGPRYHSATR